MTTSTAQPFLAASLIVRDEEANIRDCLRALSGVVDRVHVHDTGSTDGTPELAARRGAVVTRGVWQDDFAAARNAALDGVTAEWVLSVDADEVVVANRRALRRFLESTPADILVVHIQNRNVDGESFHHQTRRLFRPAVAHWQGRLHEQVVGRHGIDRIAEVSADILTLVHHGYATAEVLRTKGERNAQLARAALAELAARVHTADPAEVGRNILDLGRSLLGADQLQDAVDAFEAVRDLCPDTPAWLDATDFLARMMLDAGMIDVALTLILQLRAVGASPSYCDWLEAQCHAKLGRFGTAQDLLAGVTEVIDLAGRRRDPETLAGLKRQIASLAGAI